MRQFQVPQFLTIEDKVFGPFTIKQFIYLGGGALLIVFGRMFLEAYLFFPIAIFIAGVALALAFLKINERPLMMLLKNALFYFLRPRLYIWQRGAIQTKPVAPKLSKQQTPVKEPGKKVSWSKISELAWSLDVKEKLRE